MIRHAHAGSRGGAAGFDFDRPLSPKGHAQRAHLESLLAACPIDAVYSSPYSRCIETVAGIAAARDLAVEERDELLEGGDAEPVLALIARTDPRHAVLCSHGDVIPRLLRRLGSTGVDGVNGTAQKGSLWVLETDGAGRVVAARYEPPGVPD